MKVLVYGCGDFFLKISLSIRADWNIDFTDSDEKKWNKDYLGKQIISVDEVCVEKYTFCCIGSIEYEEEIRECCLRLGFSNEQIVPGVYLEYQNMKWKRRFVLKAWEQHVEKVESKVIKNWFATWDDLECVLQCKDVAGSELIMTILCPWNFPVQLCIESIGEDTKRSYMISNIIRVFYPINRSNEIVVLRLKNYHSTIPWIQFNIAKMHEWNCLEKHPQYEQFLWWYGNSIGDFYYHDEDYIALKDMNVEGTIVDVGAQFGQSMNAFYRMTSAKIVSIEPSPDLYRLLLLFKQTFDHDHRISLINSGVSDKKADLLYYMPSDFYAAGSFDKLFMDGLHPDVPLKTYVLECNTLDELLKDETDIWFVKLDVECFEYKAIQGMMGTIKTFFPIILIEENAQRVQICQFLSTYYDLYYYDDLNDIFVKERISGINYWLLPKKEFRKGIVKYFLDSKMQKAQMESLTGESYV